MSSVHLGGKTKCVRCHDCCYSYFNGQTMQRAIKNRGQWWITKIKCKLSVNKVWVNGWLLNTQVPQFLCGFCDSCLARWWKLVYTPTKEKRDTVTGRRAQLMPCPGYCPQPVKGPFSPSLKDHRGTVSDQETKLGALRKGPLWGLLPGLSPESPCPGVKPVKTSQTWSTFPTEGGLLPGGVGHIMDAGEEQLEIAQGLLQDVQGRNQEWAKGWS